MSPISTARQGRDRELRVAHRLQSFGWELIARSAASKGPADLVMAHELHGLALIQVGTANKRLGPAARERLLHAAELCSALPLLATPHAYGYRLRIVSHTPAQSWLVFDPVNGFEPPKASAPW